MFLFCSLQLQDVSVNNKLSEVIITRFLYLKWWVFDEPYPQNQNRLPKNNEGTHTQLNKEATMDNFRKYFKSLREKSGAAVSEDELKRFAQQAEKEADIVKSISDAAVSEKEIEEIRKRLGIK